MAHDDFIHLCGYFYIIGDNKVSLKKKTWKINKSNIPVGEIMDVCDQIL